jgi:hypothetical protein
MSAPKRTKGGWKDNLLRQADIKASTRIVGLTLCEVWASSKPPFDRMRPSVPTLARTAGVSERTCQSALTELVKRGLLHVVRHGGPGRRGEGRNWTTEYRLGWPLEDVGVVQNLHQGGAENDDGVVQILHPNPHQENPHQGNPQKDTGAPSSDTAEGEDPGDMPTGPVEPSYLPIDWQPNKFHGTKFDRLTQDHPHSMLDLDEQPATLTFLVSLFTDQMLNSRRRNWDSAFSAWMAAYANDRSECEWPAFPEDEEVDA